MNFKKFLKEESAGKVYLLFIKHPRFRIPADTPGEIQDFLEGDDMVAFSSDNLRAEYLQEYVISDTRDGSDPDRDRGECAEDLEVDNPALFDKITNCYDSKALLEMIQSPSVRKRYGFSIMQHIHAADIELDNIQRELMIWNH